MRWYKIFFGTFLLAFFSLVGFSSSVYAIDDYSVTLNWDTLSEFYLCGRDSGRNCSDYTYFISTPSNSCSGSGSSYFISGLGAFYDNAVISVCNTIISPVSNSSVIFLTGGKNQSSRYTGDFTVTLTDHFGKTCPEPDPCPEPEQCPEASATPYADKFDNIEKAIYTCGAILIMLYFFYCIYRMIIKGSGVN